ncbi:hypothetical protein TNCV_4115101 [Trichonephila clavipes]|nr:hypothetical protein TNCV_4115101 [Trichonephila clavipes]
MKSLGADYHRTRVWRRTGQRSDPAFIVERHTAIHKVPFINNARPHTARLSQQLMLPWPSRSPDLSPIDNLGRAGKATAAVPRYRRINCADAKTMAGSSTGGHK